jgi:transposase InsO family protein
MDKFKYYIYGGKVEVFTDHKAIVFLLNKQKELSGRIARWCLKLKELQEYVTFKFKKGSENFQADCLSRYPIMDMVEGSNIGEICDVYAITVEKKNNFERSQNEDGEIQNLITILKSQNGNTKEKRKVKKFCLIDDILYKKCKNVVDREIYQLVVPEKYITEVIGMHHDGKEAYHSSINKTVAHIQQNYYFPNMQEVVKGYVNSCEKCQLFKENKMIPFGELTERKVHKEKLSFQMDTIGPMLPDRKGMKYVITLIETYSSFVIVRAVKNIKTISIIRFLTSVLRTYKISYLRTDLHRTFTSDKFINFAQRNGIQLIRSLAFSPHCNGKIESFHRNLKVRLAMKCSGNSDYWSNYVQEVVRSINSTPEGVSKITPYQMLHDRVQSPIGEDKYPIRLENSRELSDDEKKIQNEKIVGARHLQFLRNKKYFDRHHKKFCFKVGDLVRVTNLGYEININKAFKQRFTGPWKVLEIVGQVTYKLELCDSPVIRVFHVSRLRNYFIR